MPNTSARQPTRQYQNTKSYHRVVPIRCVCLAARLWLDYITTMSPRAQSELPEPDNLVDRPLRDAIASLQQIDGPLMLAVSGGGDSMVLLHAMARWAPGRVAVVATFDHGTGTHATQAAALVVREARLLGFNVVRERARRVGKTEAAWREARWAFLHRVAGAYGARVVTAHSQDDQLETVVQRLLRGTGARGLAALAAPGPVVRPWLSLSRAQLTRYRESHAVPIVPDPGNHDRRHQRVRVREDLLPAIARVDATFAADMLDIASRAAAWRRDVDAFVHTLPWRELSDGAWQLDRAALAGWSAESLAVMWPALLGPCGITLDGTGTSRLVGFTLGGARAGELLLPGGATVVRRGDVFEVRSAARVARDVAARHAPPVVGMAGNTLRWAHWRLAVIRPGSNGEPAGSRRTSQKSVPTSAESSLLALNMAAFPRSGVLEVRGWRAGDRIRNAQTGALRRISRYLAEYGVPRRDRSGWPVVLVDGEVVWVPDIVRGPSAPSRSGRSDFVWYRSEREFS